MFALRDQREYYRTGLDDCAYRCCCEILDDAVLRRFQFHQSFFVGAFVEIGLQLGDSGADLGEFFLQFGLVAALNLVEAFLLGGDGGVERGDAGLLGGEVFGFFERLALFVGAGEAADVAFFFELGVGFCCLVIGGQGLL